MPSLPPIKEFILKLLAEAGEPLSTSRIYKAFDAAGYNLTTASIRGRINSLTYQGKITRVGHGLYADLSSQFFNLIICANERTWDQQPARLDRSRFLEYTKPEIIAEFEDLSPEALSRLVRFPTLFAYEHGVGKSAHVGVLKDIHIVRNSIEVWFEFSSTWPAIDSERLAQAKDALAFGKNEAYRTHWAIKQGNLYQALRGIGILPLDRKEEKPSEPPPGPGPQYVQRNGKLSEDASFPNEDEVSGLLALHTRLKVDAANLSEALKSVDNKYPELVNIAREYAGLLSSETAEVDVTAIWSVGGALATFAQSYREQNIVKTLAEPLEPQLAAQLSNVVRQHGAFIMGFSTGRDLVHRADEFALDTGRIREIEEVGNSLLDELSYNNDLVDRPTQNLHRPIRASVEEFGWAASRSGYAAYLVVRNCVRATIKYTLGDNLNVTTIVGLLVGVSTVAGDPNAEFIRAAIPFLQHYGSQMIAFFNHSPEMRAYIEWALRILEQDNSIRKSD